MNGQIINGANVAKEAGISRSHIDNDFSILVDTLVGHFLRAYRPQIKVREVAHPKFYWFDVGVARAAAGALKNSQDPTSRGFDLETLVFHDLRVYNDNFHPYVSLYYYATTSEEDIDFVIETQSKTPSAQAEVILLEIKSGTTWKREWEKNCRRFANNQKVKVAKMIGVYLGSHPYVFDDFFVYPYQLFVEKLFAKEFF